MWLTDLADGSVIIFVIGHVLLGGTITLENISLDVEELSCLDKIEQAQRFEEAERQIDEVQRAAPSDPDYQHWVDAQRQYLMEVQQLIFEC